MLTDHEDIRRIRRPGRHAHQPSSAPTPDDTYFDVHRFDAQLVATERDRDDARAEVGRLHAELDRIRRALLDAGEVAEECRDVPEAVERVLGRLRGAEPGLRRRLRVARPGELDYDDPWHSASGLPTIRRRS